MTFRRAHVAELLRAARRRRIAEAVNFIVAIGLALILLAAAVSR